MSTQNIQKALTSVHIQNAKGKDLIVMLTAYDYPSAILADGAGVDIILVGDSLGMAVLGHKDTLAVSMDIMLHHCKAVSAAQSKALVVCDMPFLSYETGPKDALCNAGKLMAQGGARAVKLEGGTTILPQIRTLVQAGIPVMGHLGLTPQRVATLGGYSTQGRSAKAAYMLLDEAKALEDAGCFSIVLECIPKEVASLITSSITIPTIGIGAGAGCDGQVLVWHDLLGLNPGHTPKFVKKYVDLSTHVNEALKNYAQDVRNGTYPQDIHSTSLNNAENEELEKLIKGLK